MVYYYLNVIKGFYSVGLQFIISFLNNICIISAAFNDTHAYKFMLRFYICSKVKLTLCEN